MAGDPGFQALTMQAGKVVIATPHADTVVRGGDHRDVTFDVGWKIEPLRRFLPFQYLFDPLERANEVDHGAWLHTAETVDPNEAAE